MIETNGPGTQNPDIADTATRRALRTLIQLIAAGGLTALFEQIARDVPRSYTPYVLIVSTVLVAVCMNYAENAGWIAPVLKTKVDARMTRNSG